MEQNQSPVEQRRMQTPFAAYGIECGEGWRGLYAPLIDLCAYHNVEVMQVKEKFGTLRFYTGPTEAGKTDLDLLITAAEHFSGMTCEDCGEHGVEYGADFTQRKNKATTGPSETSSWLRTLCQPCREAWDAKRKVEMNAQRARLKAKDVR